MKVRFKYTLVLPVVGKITIDELVEGANATIVVKKLRTAIANKKVKVVFWMKKLEALSPGILPDTPKSITNTAFYKILVDYYNTKMKPVGTINIACPKTDAAFIATTAKIGMATVVEK